MINYRSPSRGGIPQEGGSLDGLKVSSFLKRIFRVPRAMERHSVAPQPLPPLACRPLALRKLADQLVGLAWPPTSQRLPARYRFLPLPLFLSKYIYLYICISVYTSALLEQMK